MDKQREAFETWCEENGEVVTIEGRKYYPHLPWIIWQAAIAYKHNKLDRLKEQQEEYMDKLAAEYTDPNS
jgi:hypothetical protein